MQKKRCCFKIHTLHYGFTYNVFSLYSVNYADYLRIIHNVTSVKQRQKKNYAIQSNQHATPIFLFLFFE